MLRTLRLTLSVFLASATLISTQSIAGKELERVSHVVELSEEDVEAVREGVGRFLIDPYSAKYEGVVSGGDEEDDQMPYVCGLVNAKNRFGAYVGREYFFGLLSRWRESKFLVVQIGDGEDVRPAKTLCEEVGLDPRDYW